MPTRRRATGSKGQKSGSRQIKPVNYSEGENDEDKSDVSESENDTNEEESIRSKEKTPVKSSPVNRSPVKRSLVKRSPVNRKNMKNGGNQEKRKIDDSESGGEMDDEEEEATVNMTMPSSRKSAGSRGWRSGRPKEKPVNYSEGENDEDKSDVSESENDTNEEESVKSKGRTPAGKQNKNKKDKHVKKTEQRGRKKKSSESEDETDDENEEIIVSKERTPAGKQKTVQRERKRKSNDSENESDDENEEIIVSRERTPTDKQKTVQRGRKRKSNDSENESDDENEEIIVSREKTPAKNSPVKCSPVKRSVVKRKNVKNGGNSEKRKIDDSESDEEMDGEEEEATVETSSPKKSSKGATPKKSPVEKEKKKLRTGDGEKCLICNRTTMTGINHGVESCSNCKTFFTRHSANDGQELTCRVNDSCDLDSTKHTSICPSCRYQKCVELGMDTEEETTEGSRKSTRIVSLEKIYKESDEDEDDIYLPFTKKKRRPNYYESSDSEIDESDDGDDGDDPNDVDWNTHTRMTFEEVSYRTAKQRKVCAVCKSLTTPTTHYGLNTCDYCYETFRRALNNVYVPRCISKNRKCDVKGGKSKCRFCTISRYLDLTLESNPNMENEKYKEKVGRLEEVLYSDNPQKLALEKNPCKICGAIAEGVNLGVSSCHCCCAFYRNCLKGKGKLNPEKFVCLKNEMCKLNRGKDPVKYKSNFCKDCRFKKCLKMGMTIDKQPADE